MSAFLSMGLVWALAATVQTAGWLWQRQHRNAGIVDVLWSASLGGSAVLLAWLGDGALAPRITLAALGGLWGLRLALHLWFRVRGEPEDGRYAQLRGRWQEDQRKWFAFFQFQALLVVLFAVPFVAVAHNPVASITPWLVAGIGIWIACVVGEASAPIHPIAAAPAGQACGGIPAIRTISSNGCTGSHTSCLRSARRGGGCPGWDPS
jgi:steroid 5-alpha reductase family enzyme